MSSARSNQTGTCPLCDSTIPSSRVLIEYETDAGTTAYAECPACGAVVHPD